MKSVTQTLMALSTLMSGVLLSGLRAEAGAPGLRILYDDIVNGYYPADYATYMARGRTVGEDGAAGGEAAAEEPGAGALEDGDDGVEPADDDGSDGDEGFDPEDDGDAPAEDGAGGHENNGHGNNADGVDSSNPGQGHGGPNGAEDTSCPVDGPCVDDERAGGGAEPRGRAR